MGNIQTPPSLSGVIAPNSTTADIAVWLENLLITLASEVITEPQGKEIQVRLKVTSFEALLGAIDRARPGLGATTEIALLHHWIEANEGTSLLYAAWFNIGVRFAHQGNHANAIIAYRNTLALRPDMHGAAINLGLLLETGGQPDQALVTWQNAMQSDAAHIALQSQQGRLLEKLGRLEEAEKILHRVLMTDPSQMDVVHHWVHIRQKSCQWPVATSDIPGLSAAELVRGSGPLGILALTDEIELQNEAAAAWISRKTEPAPRRLAPEKPYPHDRIRIGYLSSDFCSHAMSYLITELFERHDRRRFEVFGYCSSQDDGTELRKRVLAAFDHYRIIRTLSDEQAAQIIRNDEIDVLIDLNGITDGSRLAVLRWRPAPIQATYLGFVGPVPLPELDYLLCDNVVIPPEHEAAYRPKPLPIARIYQANDSKRTMGRKLSRAEAGLPDDCFVLCCFSKHYKITEEIFGAWMSILRQTERTVLWLAADNVFSQANLVSAARNAGIADERIIFSDRTDPDLYMSRLGLADLFLDTFPYNAGTVASDAIRMQLPLITLCGKAFASRMAASLLHAVGAPQGITTSLSRYISTAIRLANNPKDYAQYKALFTATIWNHTLGNIERFTAEFEDTWCRLVSIARDGSGQQSVPQAKEIELDPVAYQPQPIQLGLRNAWCLDDLAGENYRSVLERLHSTLHPQTYFEIGVETGETLALARCPSVAVDPKFSFVEMSCVQKVMAKPSLMFFQTTSDDFFARLRPDVLLGRPVQFAFLDGMHRCEYLLRDFINTERCCQEGSIIALHDCLPIELPMTGREPGVQSIDPRRQRMWTGDVWRTALLLKRRRPDLSIVTLNAAPTGLVLITKLAPGNRSLEDSYDSCVSEMLSWSLEDIGLAAYHGEMAIQSTDDFQRPEDITARFRGSETVVPSSLSPKSELDQDLAEAISHHHAGRTEEAEKLYRIVLASPLAPAVASYSFGMLCMSQGRLQEAIDAYCSAIAIQPDFADAYINLGAVVLSVGQRDEAVALYRYVIQMNPENAMAHGNLGKALQDLGQIDEAIAAYRAALVLEPDNAAVHLNLGAALLEQRAWDDSLIVTQQAIALQPDSAMAHANLGTALLNLGRYDEALAACHQAMALQPQGVAIHASLGGAMLELGALQEAVALCRHAIILDPALPNAHFNLSHALKAMNQLDEATYAARKAISLRPESADYHFHLAHILLLRGDLEAGWMEYEWRWKLADFAWIKDYLGACLQPKWVGEDIGDKTILIYAEQGLGDIIQFARYLPLVVQKARRVIVAAHPPTHRLLKTIDGITIVSLQAPLPDFDVHCALMSLPRAFGTRLDNIPASVPYLHADHSEQLRWSRRISSNALRVGLVWAGNPATMRDRFRSPGLASVAPLFSVPGVEFVVLQVGPGRRDWDDNPLSANVVDLGKEVTDLVDTAAIMAGLDLMISSCTATLHLAGALGVPSWAMLPFAPHFPWLLDRSATEWYPTMRLYRQDKPGKSWSGVIERISRDLAVLAQSRASQVSQSAARPNPQMRHAISREEVA